MADVMKISGLSELQAALHELPKVVAEDVMRKVLTDRAEPIADAARAGAPRATGALAKSITVSKRLSQRQYSAHSKVDPSDVEIFIGAGPLARAHILEYGTATIEARPFMRPAWDNYKDSVLTNIKEDLWKEISNAAAKAPKRRA